MSKTGAGQKEIENDWQTREHMPKDKNKKFQPTIGPNLRLCWNILLGGLRQTVSTSHFCPHDPDLGLPRNFDIEFVGSSRIENLNPHYFGRFWPGLVLIDLVNSKICVKTCRISPDLSGCITGPHCPRSKGIARAILLVDKTNRLYKPLHVTIQTPVKLLILNLKFIEILDKTWLYMQKRGCAR